ncbi:MAG: hypothetical protein GY777_03870 [Candidatus Brocadiaceae bacterium]|nr:hypothetical protein [Candidatus Brocadiaceae bacterium]
MIYLDLNMVRAGVVKHPSEWAMSGYNEIQNPPERYGLIDLNGLSEFCGLLNIDQMKNEYKQWVEDAINDNGSSRESCWTESIAVGNRQFVEDTKIKLGMKAQGRKVVGNNDQLELKEPYAPYNALFDTEKPI